MYMHTHTHQCYCCNKPLQITNHTSYILLSKHKLYIRRTVKYNKFETYFQQLHYKLTFLPGHSVSHVRLSGRLACHPSPVVQCCRRRSGDSPLLGGSWWQVWRHGDLHVLKRDFVPVQFMTHDFQTCFILSMKPNRRVKTYNFYQRKIHCKKKLAFLNGSPKLLGVSIHGLYWWPAFFVVWASLGSSAGKRVKPCEPKTCAMYKQHSKKTKQTTTKQCHAQICM